MKHYWYNSTPFFCCLSSNRHFLFRNADLVFIVMVKSWLHLDNKNLIKAEWDTIELFCFRQKAFLLFSWANMYCLQCGDCLIREEVNTKSVVCELPWGYCGIKLSVCGRRQSWQVIYRHYNHSNCLHSSPLFSFFIWYISTLATLYFKFGPRNSWKSSVILISASIHSFIPSFLPASSVSSLQDGASVKKKVIVFGRALQTLTLYRNTS